ncbi:4-(cytidine 5'-diphospho)-2-C-methyl-D-erythritol kinase [Dyadobacter chenwenxiniae]|uniref:4-diphosphocytidyl-2-C-methyl-D-erythritol kinase n=1 Tax=Dyadobacter chenwenxiniae TaxID=2906456 RepID=A0A9X1PJ03_9BACT|nr:4-(cytidine 5'-diphospho)-2-C-methyl-D-erythritol kinase [Dyadobacter chenwenxiniae]MCF0061920.1 4-(cytidine 5'-diphospho)-2-C-methyl-D-erythritol kinase [Dyadobacter chenwenxiniae]UON81734.1 4-(cytidine 5'-diphospho)-2-C-methyl-D-erythritol kinase [Dyadobacter chenwenxiniae]
MLVFPNAKINIGLNIVEKRADGYHNIESCFYPVGWSDALEITVDEQFSFQADGIPIPGGASDNLCTKAYQMIATDYPLPPVKMHLLKSIPIGAGLGGGSADAAFAIKALDQHFNLKISFEKQLDYARRLGSDCAFFIPNKPAYCFQKGDISEDIELNLNGRWIVLVNPGMHISTAEAYSGIIPKRSEFDLRIVLKEPIGNWKHKVKNDFEATLFPKYPLLAEIKEALYKQGAGYAAMSGSGSTLFGIFDLEKDLSKHFAEFVVWQGRLD